MSEYYYPVNTILMGDLFDGRLDPFSIREDVNADTSAKERCLTDGPNYVWAYGDDDGSVSAFARFGDNTPTFILWSIADVFNVEIASEYENQHRDDDAPEELSAFKKNTHVNGPRAELSGVVVTIHELEQVALYWLRERLDKSFWCFFFQSFGGYEWRVSKYSTNRLNVIASVIGADRMQTLTDKAIAGFRADRKKMDDEAWRIFTSGTPEERAVWLEANGAAATLFGPPADNGSADGIERGVGSSD